MPKLKNKETVKELRQKIATAKSITIANYAGLSSNNVNNLRTTLKNADAEMIVAKNTLLEIALKEEKIGLENASEIEKDLEGKTAVFLAYKDPVATIKAVFKFIKKVELPKIKSAIFDGRYILVTQVELISKLPSREQLLAQVIGTMQSPINGFVRTLNGVQGKLVRAFAAIADKKHST